MKQIKWIAYALAFLGVILILIGIVTALTNKHILQYGYTASYFLVGNSFLLISLVIFHFIHLDQHKRQEDATGTSHT